MTEGTIKAIPIPTIPEYPECSRVSLRPEWLKPVISSTFSYRGWKALLPEKKNTYAVYIYIRSQAWNNTSLTEKKKEVCLPRI